MTKEENQMYFAANPTAAHDEHLVDYSANGINLKFKTDAGVFSKMRVDYGSGVLIKALNDVQLPAGDILDLGAGYGPLGLFAAKIWPQHTVHLVDVNERGLDLARQNAKLNQITNVEIYASDIYEQIDSTKKFGLIITNPPIRAGKNVVTQMLAQAQDHLINGGILLEVIQKKQGEPSSRKLLQETYSNCTILTRDKGYYVLQAVNN
ncbi:class I SAM-dependent methyltransferase [Lactobacillus sp. ESL0684]|uniref:class I SAM-dependent methyltransferase n=1 Tax=Lactobacillus sp. ESL0684 TaxID=2983213 RepID=UPI0023F6BE44|nr:class I SAM-dependent methyltransferase [Lactobacillus sp. ESL0684]WEV44143.1 class I SAM-dependent methyltransferase [Lactobacillus sp. ESL0684]